MNKLKTIFLLFLITQVSFATIRYVSKTGSSTPPYTSWETASDSIQKCINICVDGDTVIVANGVYKEVLVVNVVLTLIGSSMDSCIIDGTGLNSTYPNSEGVTIIVLKNLIISNLNLIGKGAQISLSQVLASIKNSSDLTVHNCRVSNAIGGIGSIGGKSTITNVIFYNNRIDLSNYRGNNPDTSLITNCIFIKPQKYGNAIQEIEGNTLIENNILLALGTNNEYGIDLIYPNIKLIKNNIISNYNLHNIDITDYIGDTVIIENNNIGYSNSENYLTGGGIWQPTGNPKLSIRNNIIYKNRNSVNGNGPEKHRTDYNIYWKNTNNVPGTLILGEHDIIANPMFVKDDTIPGYPYNFDFHLQKYSPATDAGDPNILDADGSRSDIGMYGGPEGEIYQYIDLPPSIPKNFKIRLSNDSDKVEINWDYNTEADFSYYKIYRDTIPDFNCDSTTLYTTTDSSLLTDYLGYLKKLFYKITSVDNQGNESYSGETISINLTGMKDSGIKILSDYLLYQNYPNPFNPETKIVYSLKDKGYVKLMVYNLLGELMHVLVNEEKEAGTYEANVRFDQSISSGIYLYRIEVIGENNIPKFSDLKKMIFIK